MSSAVPASIPQRRPLVLADLVPGALVRDVVLVLAGAGLTGLLAQISVPVAGSPVPVTGQTLGAVLVGAALGWRRGLASMVLYLLAGVAGVPWYAGHSSGSMLLSGANLPTLGYILGFVVAAPLVGALAARGWDRSPLRTVAAMVLGNLAIYAVGVPYLAWSLHAGLGTGWDLGMKNYLLGDGLKILLAAGLLPGAWRLVGALQRD